MSAEDGPSSGSWAVYRIYTAEGTLLYVGMTGQGALRLRDHEQREWWRDAAAITLQHFATRGDARRAEWDAISDENPVHNSRRPSPLEVEEQKAAALELVRGARTDATEAS